jgi:hypothetical protein
MKRSYLVMALIIFSCAAKSQFNATQQANRNQNLQLVYAEPGHPAYKTQKALGWVCIGLGVGIFTGAVAHDLNNLFSTDQTSTGWYVVSGALIGTGVSLLIIGGKNKRRAKAMGFINMENGMVLNEDVFEHRLFPAVGLRFGLNAILISPRPH